MTLKISFKKFKTTRKVLNRTLIIQRKEDLDQELAIKSNRSMIVNLNKL
jgi:hypothetical protein